MDPQEGAELVDAQGAVLVLVQVLLQELSLLGGDLA